MKRILLVFALLMVSALASKAMAEDESCIVRLWDDAGYTDRILTVRCYQDVPDMNYINSDSGKKGFNDKTSSVKYNIPEGWEVILYENDHYRKRPYPLKGKGEIPDLGYFNDKTSSLKWKKIGSAD